MLRIDLMIKIKQHQMHQFCCLLDWLWHLLSIKIQLPVSISLLYSHRVLLYQTTREPLTVEGVQLGRMMVGPG